MAPIQNGATLEQLEAMAYGGNFEVASAVLMQLLQSISRGEVSAITTGDEANCDTVNLERLAWYTRMASAITRMLAADEFQPSKEAYEVLMAYKRELRSIFIASGYGELDHLQWHMVVPNGQQQGNIKNAGAMLKLLFSITPSSHQGIELYQRWLKSLPFDMVLPFWLSFVDLDIVLDKRSASIREAMVAMSENLDIPPQFQVSQALLYQIVNAWMLTSYMPFEKKHACKRFLNKLLRRYGESQGVSKFTWQGPGEPIEDMAGKPRLVVLLERFTSVHAMHRSYRRHIEALREKFYTVAVSTAGAVDEESVKAFDESHTFSDEEPVEKIAELVSSLQPKMVYYPSIGMQVWSTVLAQFRLAPIQMMSLGHPATSMSSVMDYAISCDTDATLFSERLIYSPEHEKAQPVPHPDGQDFSKSSLQNNKVRIAVNAALFKINHLLIETCKEIQTKSETPVEFVFFPSCTGSTYDAFCAQLRRYMSATVYPRTDYQTYIDRLRACDLVLNPFPFGNTNGIYDCAHIGLPFVCLDGKEPHSHVDALLSESLGYPEFLRATTRGEYVAAAVRLVNDESLRSNILQQVTALGESKSEYSESSNYAQIFYKVYRYHEQLQNNEERLVLIDDYPMPS